MSAKPSAPPLQRTLRLGKPALDAVLATIDDPVPDAAARRPVSKPWGVLAVPRPNGTPIHYEVYVRALTDLGASLVLGLYLPVQTDCGLYLFGSDGTHVAARATLTRCRLIKGRVHEVGLLFVEPLGGGAAEPAGDAEVAVPEETRLDLGQSARSLAQRCEDESVRLSELREAADEIVRIVASVPAPGDSAERSPTPNPINTPGRD